MNVRKLNWFYGLLMAILGLLFLIAPTFLVKIVVVLLGFTGIIYGIYNIFYTKKTFEYSPFSTTLIIKSTASIVIGILAVVLPLSVAGAMWKIMMYVLAVFLVITACFGFYSISLLKDSPVERKRYIVENFTQLIIAIVLFLIAPEALGLFILRLIGVVLLLLGVFIAILNYINSKKTIVIKADVVNDDKEPKYDLRNDKSEETTESGE